MKKIIILTIVILGMGISGWAQPFDVVWTNISSANVTVTGSNNLYRSGGTFGWNEGAASQNKLLAGDSGWVEFTTNDFFFKGVGLNTVFPDPDYNKVNIAYLIWLKGDGTVYVEEGGNPRGTFGSYSNGDIFRVERIGTTIEYKKNGTTFYTSTLTSTEELIVAATFGQNNGIIYDAQTSFDINGNSGVTGTPMTDCADWEVICEPDQLTYYPVSDPDKLFSLDDSGRFKAEMIYTEQVTVKPSEDWPDYVFGQKYYLRPLVEVEQFIDKNHHLPNIPSAKEVKASGIELGEMNRLLLEKIEELTLYTIEQEKELDQQQQQIDLLKEENNLVRQLSKEIQEMRRELVSLKKE